VSHCSCCRAASRSRSTAPCRRHRRCRQGRRIGSDCVLHDSHDEDHIHMKPLEFPRRCTVRDRAEKRGDEQRISTSCTR
jgi:hypothetical protein